MGLSLQGARVKKSEFKNVKFTYSDLSNVSLIGCKIESCDSSDTSLNDITHKGSSIISSTLSRAFLVNTKLASLKLDGSDLSEIYISSDLKELKGAELDVSQALDVIKLIGIKLH